MALVSRWRRAPGFVERVGYVAQLTKEGAGKLVEVNAKGQGDGWLDVKIARNGRKVAGRRSDRRRFEGKISFLQGRWSSSMYGSYERGSRLAVT